MLAVHVHAQLDMFAEERRLMFEGVVLVAGVDEAGRGPLAGPVVAAAVIFPGGVVHEGLPSALSGLTDSKKLSPGKRDEFFEALVGWRELDYGIGMVEAETIDELNILRATHLAMRRAIGGLRQEPQHVLVDGLPVPTIGHPQTAMVKGDSRSYSIAAASVLAKVTRDRLMLEYDRRYPNYGFARHKGYPTPEHLDALARFGPCPIHRRSFAPVREIQLSLFTPGDYNAPGRAAVGPSPPAL
ncbi:MAG: ribonuclease HII [Verrucomicrobia bacterium]|nr:ribonuclease HII [Verrucomicrobiota bacterium]